ncbi:hypothetical protein CHLNCDRAFT_33679 [Chlorella variabilis]|uniref:RING-type E3 ubiquitin transferase n=1 Tax=Chlorella variabilis TaxID=554065 RepID=E1Z3E2_CHLVA|nr:hypothetical protein CHLNCDRAFT_33679 [Chlorella variabilis]EFN60151.1 hypothetical protein CHLNCDRAFT_33679 [Chlorella variabilis]|eukprot:XP_005852253.1 hypothetical protein CHLNCDRAFT_33679 [Chlorella variabilis]
MSAAEAALPQLPQFQQQQAEVQHQQQQQAQAEPKAAPLEEEDPKAALLKGLDDSSDECLFSCNICYDLASEPVVTLCGHLYCWPCLYRWLQVQSHCRTCPVCKAGVEKDKVIPIYGRGGNEDPRSKSKGDLEAVPQRPAGQRPAPVVRNPMLQPNLNVNAQQSGLGIIPTLFGLQNGNGNGGYAEPLTPEQQHQAFLSRLLLMLGSFVIMCLLLF